MEKKSKTEHILMLPYIAQGHLRPFLELAKRLDARSTFTITILTTPLNAQSLRQKLQLTNNTTIQISELPFNGSEYGLPPGVENQDKLPVLLFFAMSKAVAALEPHLRHYISSSGQPPICIIFDHLMGWVAPVAKSFGCFGVSFTTTGAYGTCAHLSSWYHLPHLNYPENQYFPLPGFPDNHLFHRSQLSPGMRLADGTDDRSKFWHAQFGMLKGEASGWLCNSVEEIEPVGFEIFRNYFKLPVWAVGPLTDDGAPSENNTATNQEDYCIQWLSEQKPDTVLYISFGSQNTISPTQMMELAAGLELSGKPFLWVIRPPKGFDMNGEFKQEFLPEGFEERMREKKQGILIHKWAPQSKILSHKSTRVFLSHCGWNSMLEGLKQELPIIGWPLSAEQAFNSKMLVEEMGVAVELTRGFEGELRKEEVKRVVDLVWEIGEKSLGLEMKKKAIEVGKKLRDAMKEENECKGSSIQAMDDFVQAILSSKQIV